MSEECHCGEPVAFGFDGDPTHHRGMCADCDSVRCDAYPGECPRRLRAENSILRGLSEAHRGEGVRRDDLIEHDQTGRRD